MLYCSMLFDYLVVIKVNKFKFKTGEIIGCSIGKYLYKIYLFMYDSIFLNIFEGKY